MFTVGLFSNTQISGLVVEDDVELQTNHREV